MKNTTLKIQKNKKKVLNKKQKYFNQLAKRVESLEKQMIEEERKLNLFLGLFSEKIAPLELKLAEGRLKFVEKLDEATIKYKYSEAQKERIGKVILFLCNESFSEVEPTQVQEAVFDKWSEMSYKDIAEEESKGELENISEFLNEMFGMDVDAEELERLSDSPEEQAKFQQRFFDEMQAKEDMEKEQQSKFRTKKEIKQEKIRKADELLKNKNIRSVYITLVKVLHPDTEKDELLKVQKEEVMKTVTAAYEQKDLATLLKIEMEWVSKEGNRIDELDSDLLNIYINALKEQVNELERELDMVLHNPRYEKVGGLAGAKEEEGIGIIEGESDNLKKKNQELLNDLKRLGEKGAKGMITKFVTWVYENNIAPSQSMGVSTLEEMIADLSEELLRPMD